MRPKPFDRALERLRSICLALPGGREVEAWGHPTFRAGKKMFAILGGEGVELSIALNVGHDRQEELLKDARFFPTPYAAYRGWVSRHIEDEMDWSEVEKLLIEAYRRVALKRMLQELDAS